MISLKCCQCGKHLGRALSASIAEDARHICEDCLQTFKEVLKKYTDPPTDEDSLIGDILFRGHLKEKFLKAA